MAQLVVIKRYGDKMLAEADRTLLESEGIPALVSADDEGGLNPALGAITSVRLLVNDVDAEQALEMLEGT